MITEGELAPGARLNERTLCDCGLAAAIENLAEAIENIDRLLALAAPLEELQRALQRQRRT